jgi:hypothetical protein
VALLGDWSRDHSLEHLPPGHEPYAVHLVVVAEGRPRDRARVFDREADGSANARGDAGAGRDVPFEAGPQFLRRDRARHHEARGQVAQKVGVLGSGSECEERGGLGQRPESVAGRSAVPSRIAERPDRLDEDPDGGRDPDEHLRGGSERRPKVRREKEHQDRQGIDGIARTVGVAAPPAGAETRVKQPDPDHSCGEYEPLGPRNRRSGRANRPKEKEKER